MLAILIIWLATVPLWGLMFTEVITAPDPEKVLQILYRLVPFYACYSVSLVLQAAMISIGRTRYLLAESVIVNVLYYGTVYSLHLLGVFPQSMDFVIAMLGFGFVVGMIADAVFCVKTKRRWHPTGIVSMPDETAHHIH